MHAHAQRILRRAHEAANGCLESAARVGSHGYPQASANGRVGTAHRLLWELVNGPIGPGLVVRHRCNNKLCVRLEHLVLGTHHDNMEDHARTLSHPRRKLTSDQAREIKALLAEHVPQRLIAARFGITQHSVHAIKRGLSYRFD